MRLLMEFTICFIQTKQRCDGSNQIVLMTFSYVSTSDKNLGNSNKKRLDIHLGLDIKYGYYVDGVLVSGMG